jgi:hypothetical protein
MAGDVEDSNIHTTKADITGRPSPLFSGFCTLFSPRYGNFRYNFSALRKFRILHLSFNKLNFNPLITGTHDGPVIEPFKEESDFVGGLFV